MASLKQFLEYNGFTANEQFLIQTHFIPKSCKKGDFFIESGMVCDSIGFIETGGFQFYYFRDGDEITTYVSGENNFAVSLSSFLKQVPSALNVRALADSEIQVISKTDFDFLKREIPRFLEFYIGLLEYQITCIEDSRFNLITLSAEERYQKLLNEEPHLIQELSVQHLASILGITPRHLSRIRKKS